MIKADYLQFLMFIAQFKLTCSRFLLKILKEKLDEKIINNFIPFKHFNFE